MDKRKQHTQEDQQADTYQRPVSRKGGQTIHQYGDGEEWETQEDEPNFNK